jgi:hypothetical protein
MPRFFTLSAMRTIAMVVLATALVTALLPHATRAADAGKQLQRVRGTIGYQTAAASNDFKTIFGKFDLPDDDFAVTRAQSAAVVAMPDSSLISLGENTTVQVGAFDNASASPGSTITVNGGTLRFDIRRPAGGAANYHFLTPTSQIAVRGTVGLLAFSNGVTTVGCVVCAADSVTLTAAGQTVTLVTGQFVTVSALGAITTGTLSSVVGAFSSAGVPVTGQVGAAAAGIPGAAAGIAVPAVAGAAVAGTAIGIAASNKSTPQPQASPTAIPSSNPTSTPVPTPTPTLAATPTPTPTPVGTPTGTVNLTGHPAAAPTGSTAARAPLAAPLPAPMQTEAPGAPGRSHR